MIFKMKDKLQQYEAKPTVSSVSRQEFLDLRDRFEVLCEHLGVTVSRPYGFQVTKRKYPKGGDLAMEEKSE